MKTTAPFAVFAVDREHDLKEPKMIADARLTVRALTEADLDAADAILMPAYALSRSRKPELRRYLALQPDGWLLAALEGEPVGLVGAIDYGPFAYVGLMGVHPAAQRRGVATLLMERLLAWLDGRGSPMVLLDASAAGAPLYAKLGFVEHDKALQFRQDDCALRPRPSERVSPLRAEDIAALAEFDAPIFGANRAPVLASFFADAPGRAFVARDVQGWITGYLFAQARRVGPWAARDTANAEALLGAALALPFDGAPEVIVPGLNANAGRLLMRYGFSPLRSLHHMRRGVGAAGQRTVLYGQASFAIG